MNVYNNFFVKVGKIILKGGFFVSNFIKIIFRGASFFDRDGSIEICL